MCFWFGGLLDLWLGWVWTSLLFACYMCVALGEFALGSGLLLVFVCILSLLGWFCYCGYVYGVVLGGCVSGM